MPYLQTSSFRLAANEQGDPSAAKLALVLPGRLESKDYAHIKSHQQQLANLGYFSVAFDPPGSWDSAGDIGMYTITNYLRATEELIAHYGNRPTILVGHSLGGKIALLETAQSPHITACIALMTSLANPKHPDTPWQQAGTLTFCRDLPPGNQPTLQQQRYDLPYSFVEDAQNYDIPAAFASCTKPKLLVAGAQDRQNLLRYLHRQYQHIAEPKQLIELTAGHSYRYNPALIEQVNSIIKQFISSL